MAEKSRRGRPKKLHKSDTDFFEVIGGRGGNKTKENHGPDYYAKIARLAHASRRRNRRAAILAQTKALGAADAAD